ncbi:MAG: TetR family transcriptional regulator [Deltaproteobacteria bacterium]|nr:TetR family transcriptional regulator [Deltaproteobacteria bacterium]MBW1875320.1 TetR family transcriptional regulator [Deltaproteobacteria bacterium]MBW2211314.1 TetR family transcriptional regulator [Deltaproteobacteria bacterium]
MDAILEATARVLVEVGYERASTNRIARIAGVSIGSLYQYFPGKEALVAALVERHVDRITALLDQAFDRIEELPPRDAARALVTAVLSAQAVDGDLHRLLIEQIPRVGRLQRITDVERRFAERTRDYLKSHRRESAIRNADIAAPLIVYALHGILFGLARTNPAQLQDAAVTDEIVALVTRYLGGSP